MLFSVDEKLLISNGNFLRFVCLFLCQQVGAGDINDLFFDVIDRREIKGFDWVDIFDFFIQFS